MMSWNTDSSDLAEAIAEFEKALPGFWWSVGQCSVGAHASCAIDSSGVQSDLLSGKPKGHPYDEGFHCDTIKGQPAAALLDVMRQACDFIAQSEAQ